MTVDPGERELLAELFGMAVIGVDFNRGLEEDHFGFRDDPLRQNWVERYPYQSGLLVSYWDSSQTDNDASLHPGEGLILPIDAHPDPLIRADGLPWSSRRQAYDSPFGLSATDPITLHFFSQPTTHGGLPAVPVFDDRKQYWRSATPSAGVKNPHTRTAIAVTAARS